MRACVAAGGLVAASLAHVNPPIGTWRLHPELMVDYLKFLVSAAIMKLTSMNKEDLQEKDQDGFNRVKRLHQKLQTGLADLYFPIGEPCPLPLPGPDEEWASCWE